MDGDDIHYGKNEKKITFISGKYFLKPNELKGKTSE